ncbi:MAG: nicotinate phosphoribosyltransferase [Acidimicrobiales bacterium]
MTTYRAVDTALFTDLYELTMAAAYHAEGMAAEVVSFELFVRSLPEARNFLVACGLDDVLAYVEGLRFDEAAIGYLRTLDLFDDGFLAALGSLRFTGDVHAIPEGEVVFAGEPLVRVTAPLIEAQLLETFLINALATQTMIASKAARVALACGDRSFVDFSARRDHGTSAAMAAARAAFVGGAGGTSLVEAGRRYGLSLSGTMAHSYVMAFDDEVEAFRAYARRFPGHAVLLLDTYDTLEGARRTVEVAKEHPVSAVRLDSGDLGSLAVDVRRILDDGGFAGIRLFASGDLDEYRIAELLGAGAPIDAFGVGTRLGTSADAPSLGMVYKLVEDAGGPRMKLAEGKRSVPGRKQVWRRADGDVLALEGEDVPGGRPLLVEAVRSGRRVLPAEPLAAARDRRATAVGALPDRLRSLAPATPEWPVELSRDLSALADQLSLALSDGAD